jgi:hypothetical protein
MADDPKRQARYHSEAWWKNHPEVPRPDRVSKAKKPAKKKITRKQKEKFAKVFTFLGLAAGFGSWGYFVVAPNPSLVFGSLLLVCGFIFCTAAFWEYVEWGLKVKIPLLIVATITVGGAGFRWIRHITRPSFTLMIPGVVLNGDSWDFIINHRGPKTSESVQILFVDKDRQAAVLAAKPKSLTPEALNTYQRILNYPQVNPKGHGNIFAQQFIWTPLILDHEHYAIEITAKDRNVHQDLRIERVQGKWVWASQIRDAETGEQLLNCKDPGFPYGPKASIRCFPDMTKPSD